MNTKFLVLVCDCPHFPLDIARFRIFGAYATEFDALKVIENNSRPHAQWMIYLLDVITPPTTYGFCIFPSVFEGFAAQSVQFLYG